MTAFELDNLNACTVLEQWLEALNAREVGTIASPCGMSSTTFNVVMGVFFDNDGNLLPEELRHSNLFWVRMRRCKPFGNIRADEAKEQALIQPIPRCSDLRAPTATLRCPALLHTQQARHSPYRATTTRIVQHIPTTSRA